MSCRGSHSQSPWWEGGTRCSASSDGPPWLLYLSGRQEGQHEEDGGQRDHLRSSLTLQQRVDRHGQVEHEEAQQVLSGHQPRLPAKAREKIGDLAIQLRKYSFFNFNSTFILVLLRVLTQLICSRIVPFKALSTRHFARHRFGGLSCSPSAEPAAVQSVH